MKHNRMQKQQIPTVRTEMDDNWAYGWAVSKTARRNPRFPSRTHASSPPGCV